MRSEEKKNMPKGWKVANLEDVCQIYDNLRKPINSEERLKRISGKNIKELFPYYGSTGLVGYIDDYLTDGEYVLLGEDAAPFLDYAKDVAYLIKGKTWVNNHAHILKSYFNNKYLLHYLNSFNYIGYVSGTTRLKLTQASMKKMPIKISPLAEQHRIVEKIEELFSALDKGREYLEKVLAQCALYRQSVLKSAFEGKLTNTTVKDGELPEGWEKRTLGSVSEKIQIGPFGSQLHREDYIVNGIPLINPMHIKQGKIIPDNSYSILESKRDSLPNYILQNGDVIMGRRGEMGRCGLVQDRESGWFCGTGSLFIRPLRTKLNPKYLYLFLNSDFIKKYLKNNAAGTTMANLNSSIVQEIPIAFPKLSEQEQIVQEIEKRLSVNDHIEQSVTESLAQTEALRQSILKKAFEGTLVPQNPDDEPAAILLERIKAEREAEVAQKEKKTIKKTSPKAKKVKVQQQETLGL